MEKRDKSLDLVALRYCENGVLEMTPDFTYNKKPYRVEVTKSYIDRYRELEGVELTSLL